MSLVPPAGERVDYWVFTNSITTDAWYLRGRSDIMAKIFKKIIFYEVCVPACMIYLFMQTQSSRPYVSLFGIVEKLQMNHFNVLSLDHKEKLPSTPLLCN